MKITISVILICIFVFILQYVGIVGNNLAFMPAEVISKPYTLVTSIFMHGSLRHLILNMVGLFIFGSIVENEVGIKNWMLIYIFSGFVGSLGYFFLADSVFIPALGASGAIFGLMGAAAILKPMQLIYTPYGPFPMIIAAIVWGITEIISSFGVGTVAHSAHFFGLIGGASFVFLYKKDIDIKLNASIIAIPIIFILFMGMRTPNEIHGFMPEIIDCDMVSKVEEINFKYYEYHCDESILITRTTPYVANIEPSYYNEYFPRIVSNIYFEWGVWDEINCSIKNNHIDIDNEIGLISNWGNICNHEYLNFAIKCNNVRYEIIQIYKDEPPVNQIDCNILQKDI